ncbi:effector-associated constant component EACC1 [Streptomyces sp. NPDC003635]
MDIAITSTADEAELRSLYLWLRDDSYVRRHARVEVLAEQPLPGRMGGALDVVQLVLDSGFQLGNLALAWAAWRATRPAPPEVTFERDGIKVTLSGQDPETAARLLAALDR